VVNIIPVMDLMNGIAVSGKSGNRATYSPLNSVFANNSDPIAIANSLKIKGYNELYIADLDSIEKIGHNLDKIKLINTIIPVILDCGIKNFDGFKFYLDFAYKLIIATETLESLDELHKIINTFPKERIVISVDIKDNELYSKSENFNLSLDEFIEELIAISPNEIILLDISKVGTNSGINQDLIAKFSQLYDKLILGGGISKEDLSKIDELGIKKVLIGSSIHNGFI
jgi:phosphoribosylformimino-5-aminoimidazole carboxamide ribotide isomerase